MEKHDFINNFKKSSQSKEIKKQKKSLDLKLNPDFKAIKNISKFLVYFIIVLFILIQFFGIVAIQTVSNIYDKKSIIKIKEANDFVKVFSLKEFGYLEQMITILENQDIIILYLVIGIVIMLSGFVILLFLTNKKKGKK